MPSFAVRNQRAMRAQNTVVGFLIDRIGLTPRKLAARKSCSRRHAVVITSLSRVKIVHIAYSERC